MLRLYGARWAPAAAWIALRYSRYRYRRLARRAAAQIADYVASGFSVVGVVGIDGSPSCGVDRSIDVRGFARSMARAEPETLTVERQNAMVRRHAVEGRGLFTEALERELLRRGVRVPMLAHDLFDELDGKPSTVHLEEMNSAGRAAESLASRIGCLLAGGRDLPGRTGARGQRGRLP
jgi:hypothetical protein